MMRIVSLVLVRRVCSSVVLVRRGVACHPACMSRISLVCLASRMDHGQMLVFFADFACHVEYALPIHYPQIKS